jgi:hypothetical protein
VGQKQAATANPKKEVFTRNMKLKIPAEDTAQREQQAPESENMQPDISVASSPEEIRERAYELHLEGGCVHGRDLDDWLQAERDLKDR